MSLPRLFDPLGQMKNRPQVILGVDGVQSLRQAIILLLAGDIGKEVELPVGALHSGVKGFQVNGNVSAGRHCESFIFPVIIRHNSDTAPEFYLKS